MNKSGISTILADRIEQAIRLRYSPFPELSMEILTQQLNNFRVGELRPAARTWEIMFERDGELAAPAIKRFEAIAGLDWEIMPVDESPEAQKHADALKYFYGHCKATTVLDGDEIGDVSVLIQQVASAIAFRYSVHEIILRIDNAGKREVTAEFRHCPVWFFEARKGRLGYLRQQWDVYGDPLLDGEWLAAVGYGLMRQCSIAYAIKHFPLRDWLLYCSRFGLPGIHGETPAAKGSQEWTDFEAALAAFANNWITLTGIGPKITLIEAAKGSGTLPFGDLVERSDRLYSKLFRGSDLATSSRGKDAVGASVQSGEGEILTQRDAVWMSGIFNARIDQPILRYLFNAEPLAWFRLQPPQQDTTDRDLKTAEFMVAKGADISVKTARERFGWPEPEAGEPVLSKPEPVLPGLGNVPGPVDGQNRKDGNKGDLPLANTAGDWRQEALAQAMGVVPEWLAPMESLFNDLENILQDMSKTDADVLAWIENAAKQFPEKFGQMDLGMLSRRLEAAMGAAVVAGVEEGTAKNAKGAK